MPLTKNLDVVGLISRSRRFKKEWQLSASANGSYLNTADANRLRSYLDSLLAYIKFFQAEPELDVPEYHGAREFDLGSVGESIPVESESVNDLMKLWDMFEIELASCQSSRRSFRLISHDEKRTIDILDRMRRFLEDYMVQVLPLDLPESSPMAASVPDGRTGINPK